MTTAYHVPLQLIEQESGSTNRLQFILSSNGDMVRSQPCYLSFYKLAIVGIDCRQLPPVIFKMALDAVLLFELKIVLLCCFQQSRVGPGRTPGYSRRISGTRHGSQVSIELINTDILG